MDSSYYILDASHTQDSNIRRERARAQALRKTQWWLTQLNRGTCHYCGGRFERGKLSMDHIVPIARGGRSVKGNVVVACASCNQNKKLHTPVDLLLAQGRGAGA